MDSPRVKRASRVKCRSRSDRWRSRAAWRSRAMYLWNVKWTKVIAYAYDAWRVSLAWRSRPMCFRLQLWSTCHKYDPRVIAMIHVLLLRIVNCLCVSRCRKMALAVLRAGDNRGVDPMMAWSWHTFCNAGTTINKSPNINHHLSNIQSALAQRPVSSAVDKRK